DFLETNDGWVIDGNYRRFLQKERLEQADQIVILSFPRLLCFYRAWKRFFRNKNRTRESMATGCAEKMDREFMRWILWEGRTKKRWQSYQEIAARYPEKTILLKNPRQVAQFVNRTITEESPEAFRAD
ncbi:MAG TPA: topology modulation protein, partial [Clostridia bacterium]|nr:topology modulation protein [Clostridia bacterium]